MDEGKCVLNGTPKEVFKEVETLEKVGLGVPQVTYLMRELNKIGFKLPDDIFTLEQAKKDPRPGVKPAPPALEGKVLTPELPGNSPHLSYSRKRYLHSSPGPLPISCHQLSVLALKSSFHPSAFSTCTVMILPEPPD